MKAPVRDEKQDWHTIENAGASKREGSAEKLTLVVRTNVSAGNHGWLGKKNGSTWGS